MIKVLIVDDSVFMRTVIRDMLARDSSIEIAGTASDGVDALEKIQALNPDVISLDIEMPKMNGLDLLRELRKMKRRPKVLMLSSLSSKDAEMTNEAIRLGADDFMVKPKDLPHIREIGRELISKVKHLATLPSAEHSTHRFSYCPSLRTGSSLSDLQPEVLPRSMCCFPCCLPPFRQRW